MRQEQSNSVLYGLMLLILVLMLILAGGCAAAPSAAEQKTAEGAYEVVDDRGTTVHIPAKPVRVMTFTTGTDEVVLGVIPPERMIAINEAYADEKKSNLAPLAARIPNKIQRNPAVETVLSLHPDLVIVQDWIPLDNVEALRDMGLPVVVCKTPHNIADIKENIRLIAASLGEGERGERLIQLMEKQLNALTAKIAQVPAEKKGRSIALISIMPGYGGEGCTFDDVCKYTGNYNAKALSGNKNGQAMTKEQLVACNPDYIFLPSYEDQTSREELYGASYMNDPSLAMMKAVRHGNIRYPWAHYIYNISQNIVFGVQEMARILYGEDFAQPHDRHLSVADD